MLISSNSKDVPKNTCLSEDLDDLGFALICFGKAGMVGYDPYSENQSSVLDKSVGSDLPWL